MTQIIKTLFLTLILCQMACTDTPAQKQKKKEYLLSWAAEHSLQLDTIIETMISHPNIARVESFELEFMPKNGEFTSADHKAYKYLLNLSDAIGIRAITLTRASGKLDENLIVATIVLTSNKSMGKGYILIFQYIFDERYIDKAKKDGYIYQRINKTNWYLVEHET